MPYIVNTSPFSPIPLFGEFGLFSLLNTRCESLKPEKRLLKKPVPLYSDRNGDICINRMIRHLNKTLNDTL